MGLRKSLASWFYPPEVLYGDQFNFGNREILIASNNLDKQTVFLGVIQHGWIPRWDEKSRNPQLRTRFFGKAPMFVWSLAQKKYLEKNGYKSVYAIGSPWVHLLKAIKYDPRRIQESTSNLMNQKKLLFFPGHSIHGGAHSHLYDFDDLSELAKTHSITICLFWMDFVDPSIRGYYKNFGYEVTCVGYKGANTGEMPWAPVGGRVNFLPNLLDLVSSADVIAFEEICTTFWYAISLRKAIFMTSISSDNYYTWESGVPKLVNRYARFSTSDAFRGLTAFPLGELVYPDDQLLDLALNELGWDSTDTLNRISHRILYMKKTDIAGTLIQPIEDYIRRKVS